MQKHKTFHHKDELNMINNEDVNEKSISKLTEEKAKVIVTKLLRCLLIEFDSQDKINKIVQFKAIGKPFFTLT